MPTEGSSLWPIIITSGKSISVCPLVYVRIAFLYLFLTGINFAVASVRRDGYL